MTAFATLPDGRRLTFIHIPKNGGSSVGTWVEKNLPDGERITKIEKYGLTQHSTKKEIFISLRKRKLEPDVMFTVIRNPYSRVVSGYHFYKRQRQIDRNMTFEDFVRGAWKKNWGRVNKPQQHYIDSTVKILLKLENINEEFKQIQELTGCNAPLRKINTTNHKHYSFYYSPASRNIVEQAFKKDLTRFEYEFEQKF